MADAASIIIFSHFSRALLLHLSVEEDLKKRKGIWVNFEFLLSFCIPKFWRRTQMLKIEKMWWSPCLQTVKPLTSVLPSESWSETCLGKPFSLQRSIKLLLSRAELTSRTAVCLNCGCWALPTLGIFSAFLVATACSTYHCKCLPLCLT